VIEQEVKRELDPAAFVEEMMHFVLYISGSGVHRKVVEE
jgi:hypothetical protein